MYPFCFFLIILFRFKTILMFLCFILIKNKTKLDMIHLFHIFVYSKKETQCQP